MTSTLHNESAVLLEPGQRGRVTPLDGQPFSGTVERVIPSNSVTCGCYLVRRDEPIMVGGFSRTAYWAPVARVTAIDPKAPA